MLNIPERLKNFRRQMKKEILPCHGEEADVFAWGRELVTESGACMYREEELPFTLSLPGNFEAGLQERLELIYGVGPVTAKKFREKGIFKLSELLNHPGWGKKAEFIIRAIRQKDWETIRKAGAKDYEILALYGPEGLLFIDIETTGLYGTLPVFLAGMIYTREDKLVLCQYLARDFHEEKPLLEAIRPVLQNAPVLVSYNGRAFDWPYLASRYTMHRMPVTWRPGHLDLLHPARRCFKGKFADCRLKTIEEKALDIRRDGDIDGALIPAMYHEYVKTGNFGLIRKIIHHNAQDLKTMLYLLSHLLQIFQNEA